MAGRPVYQKLYLKPGKRLAVVRPPDDWETLLGGVPEGVEHVSEADPADIVLAFVENRTELEAQLPTLRTRLADGGALWIAYHKGTSPIDSDVNRDVIMRVAPEHDLKAVAIISVNDDWSALRLKRV